MKPKGRNFFFLKKKKTSSYTMVSAYIATEVELLPVAAASGVVRPRYGVHTIEMSFQRCMWKICSHHTTNSV